VTSTVEMVLAQRLIRLLCKACARPAIASASVRHLAAEEGYELGDVMEAVGCPECRGTGYRGRSGIYELLVVHDSLRRAVSRGSGADVLRPLAIANGMRSLRADGWRQVQLGRTTPQEVVRVTASAAASPT
jgi:general secretion pathway protein E